MVNAAEIERAILVLEAYQRGEIDESISDDLYDRLACAIEDAYEQSELPAPPMVVSA